MHTKIKICVLYCLPVFIALGLLLNSYHNRVIDIGDVIFFVQQSTLKMDSGVEAQLHDELGDDNGINNLVIYFHRQRLIASQIGIETDENLSNDNIGISGENQQRNSGVQSQQNERVKIGQQLDRVWLFNSMIVLSFTLLPFLVMSLKLTFSKQLPLTEQQRTLIAVEGFFMKFMLSCIIAICWIYIINPKGRGLGAMESYLDVVDFYRKESLPLYLRNVEKAPIIAGILGWYLHALGYILTKFTRHDVASTQVYTHLFKKFLLVYGISIILPSTQVFPEEKIGFVLFLLGFFPLAAFNFMKEQMNKLSNSNNTGGDLSILPGISRWQILRLEEEGIDTMAELASVDRKLVIMIPGIAQIVDYWINIAQLYMVVGHKNYLVLNERCNTASGFIKLSVEAEFIEFITESKLGNCDEIAQNLIKTFSISSFSVSEKERSLSDCEA